MYWGWLVTIIEKEGGEAVRMTHTVTGNKFTERAHGLDWVTFSRDLA